MKRLLFLFIILASLSVSAAAQQTTRRSISRSHPKTHVTADFDTIVTSVDSLAMSFAGYEKTLRSSTESFFVTNNTNRQIDRLAIKITYFDIAGHILDVRRATFDLDLPAHATRRVDLSSWDKQNVFYYYLSPKPRAGQATPYKVNISLVAAMALKP